MATLMSTSLNSQISAGYTYSINDGLRTAPGIVAKRSTIRAVHSTSDRPQPQVKQHRVFQGPLIILPFHDRFCIQSVCSDDGGDAVSSNTQVERYGSLPCPPG